MTIFDRFKIWKATRQNRKDANTYTLDTLWEALGIDPDTNPQALSEATYFACLKILGESMGKLPIRVLQRTEDGGIRKAREKNLYKVLHTRPNPYMSPSGFWSAVENNRNHHGNAYVWIRYDKGQPQLWLLPSPDVEVWYDNAKILAEQPDLYYIYTSAGQRYVFGSEEILHFRTSTSFDGILGLSVRDQLASTIKGSLEGQKIQNKLYESGMGGKLALNYTMELNNENREKFARSVSDFVNGRMDKAGDVTSIIPVPIGAQLQPLGIKFTDSQFFELKKYSALQIATAFGLKAYQINDLTKSSYASQEGQSLAFLTECLLYIIKQYEEELTYKLLSQEEIEAGYYINFNVAMLLRVDTATQVQSLTQGISNFLYTPNEAREMLDLPAKPGGDWLIGNGSTIRSEQVGIQWDNVQNNKEERGETDG